MIRAILGALFVHQVVGGRSDDCPFACRAPVSERKSAFGSSMRNCSSQVRSIASGAVEARRFHDSASSLKSACRKVTPMPIGALARYRERLGRDRSQHPPPRSAQHRRAMPPSHRHVENASGPCATAVRTPPPHTGNGNRPPVVFVYRPNSSRQDPTSQKIPDHNFLLGRFSKLSREILSQSWK